VELMNARYERILDAAFPGASIECLYAGEWTCTVAVLPPDLHERWASASGETFELALAALEQELDLPRWTG
jgi:hypothetical protein